MLDNAQRIQFILQQRSQSEAGTRCGSPSSARHSDVPGHAVQLILKGRSEAVPAWEAYHGCVEDLVATHQDRIERLAYEPYELVGTSS